MKQWLITIPLITLSALLGMFFVLDLCWATYAPASFQLSGEANHYFLRAFAFAFWALALCTLRRQYGSLEGAVVRTRGTID